MKVLFAVSTENIVDSIIKVYQKKYKEIISSKNVYYFNAIIKELQRNQTYDRIVISEDLEPFTNNNYDAIDKFIFEKLDNISDEAINSNGRDIPIIVICSERREKSDDLLVKLFSMGIYDALIGQDRKIEDVCTLLKKPRTKKEAKNYYRIEQGEYEHEDENNVSEVEIQNILTHFRKIGKNEEKYVESFDNIAEQYNDEQLKIIAKFLPIEVKAVLEAESPKYQSIMMYKSGNVSTKLLTKQTTEENNVKIKKIMLKNKPKIDGPIIVPPLDSGTGVKKLGVLGEEDDEAEEDVENITSPAKEQIKIEEEPEIEELDTDDLEINEEKNLEDSLENEDKEELEQPLKRGRGRPRKAITEPLEIKPKRGRGRPRKNPIIEETEDVDEQFNNIDDDEPQVSMRQIEETDNDVDISEKLPGFDDEEENENKLPEIEDDEVVEEKLPGFEDDIDEDNSSLPGFEEDDNIENDNDIRRPMRQNLNQSPLFRDRKEERNSLQTSENEEKQVNISHLLTQDKKIVAFIGTSKNGVSFLANNVSYILSERGINTALVDLTKNKNSYYIYTENRENLREIAYNSMENLKNGLAEGIHVNKNLTVYTSSPNIRNSNYSIESMLTTLAQNYSLVILDCDYTTSKEYFRVAQEIYLVQSMDVLTIQPLTEFLRKLKLAEVLDTTKLRAIVNKAQRVRNLNESMIVGGMSTYNDPEMSVQDKLFDMKTIPTTVIPFDIDAYQSYLSQIANCVISTKGYNKSFLNCLNKLADQVYPVVYGKGYKKQTYDNYNNYTRTNMQFSNNMNDTLDKMKKNYR